MIKHRLLIGFGAGILAALIWGGGAVVSRYLVTTHFEALDLAFLRYAGCFPIALVVLLVAPSYARLQAKWWQTLVLILLAGPAYHLLVIFGYNFATAGAGSLLTTGLLPVFALFLNAALLRTWPPLRAVLGALLVGLGLLTFGLNTMSAGSAQTSITWQGIAVFVTAAAMWAVLNELVRRWRINPLQLTVVLALWSPVFLPAYLWLRTDGLSLAVWPDIALQVLYHGVLVAFGGTMLFFLAIRLIGAEVAAFLQASSPAIAAVLGAVLLGEHLNSGQGIGIIVTISGIIVASLVDHALAAKRRQPPEPAAHGVNAGPP